MAEKKEKLNYEKAYNELQSIMYALQEETIALDALAEKVERAVFLINFCKTKLRETDERLSKVLEAPL